MVSTTPGPVFHCMPVPSSWASSGPLLSVSHQGRVPVRQPSPLSVRRLLRLDFRLHHDPSIGTSKIEHIIVVPGLTIVYKFRLAEFPWSTSLASTSVLSRQGRLKLLSFHSGGIQGFPHSGLGILVRVAVIAEGLYRSRRTFLLPQ